MHQHVHPLSCLKWGSSQSCFMRRPVLVVRSHPKGMRFIASTFCLTSELQQSKDTASSPLLQTKWLPEAACVNPTFSSALARVFSYPRQAFRSRFPSPNPCRSTPSPLGLHLHTALFLRFLFSFFSSFLLPNAPISVSLLALFCLSLRSSEKRHSCSAMTPVCAV